MRQEKNFYEKVAETLIKKMEEGTAPWQKNWNTSGYDSFPMNPTTGRRYRGGNMLHLMAQERSDPRWMTYNQAQQQGARIKKGEHGTPVLYWKFEEERLLKTADGKIQLDSEGQAVKKIVRLERPRMFVSYAFNAEQITGLPPLQQKTGRTWDPVEQAEQILRSSGARIEQQAQPKAYYSPVHDKIVLPLQEQFYDASGYYDTALHELGHWTGHETRLNREILNPFGSRAYACEELRAEISSMMLAGELGLPHNTENHAAYVKSWIQVVQNDPKEIFRAASDAETIFQYITELGQKQSEDFVMLLNEKTTDKDVDKTDSFPNFEIPEISVPAEKLPREERNYLHVPFSDKEIVKELGGKWDRQARSWYAPAGVEMQIFSRWQETPHAMDTEKKDPEKPSRQYLAVPYETRQQARSAGALWDSVEKSWYAGSNADMQILAQWLPGKNEEQSPAMPPREEFAEVLRQMGCIVDGEHPSMDGQPHRIAMAEDKQGQQSGFYVAYLDGRPAGYAKDNRSGEEAHWVSAGAVYTARDHESFQKQCERKKQERTAALADLHQRTSERILHQIADMQPAMMPTPYMIAKGIHCHSGAYVGQDDTTCLPAQDADGKIWTMQYIKEDGTKRFAKNGRKEGCFHPVGGMDAVRRAPAIVIAEGYATAVSLSETLGFATIAAFDAGNVISVAKSLHEKYPDFPVVIAGDDDRHLPNNPGRTKAEFAAKAVNGQAVFPVFAPDETGRGFTDFNDLAVKSLLGTEAVKRQLAPIVEKAVTQKQAALAQRKEQEQARSNYAQRR